MLGHLFTWGCGTGTMHWVEMKLDWVLVNHDRTGMFPEYQLQNLCPTSSDHSTLFLQHTQHMFRFENAWLMRSNALPLWNMAS